MQKLLQDSKVFEENHVLIIPEVSVLVPFMNSL
jgi:hypothetical protein